MRGRGRQLTGIDALIGMADAADRAGTPLADRLLGLLEAAVIPGPALFGSQAVATGPLREHEATPVRVITAAAEWSKSRRDLDTLSEVAVVGARVTAVWPRYLMTTVGGHPEYRYRETGDELRLDAEMAIDELLRDRAASSDARAFLRALEARGLRVTRSE